MSKLGANACHKFAWSSVSHWCCWLLTSYCIFMLGPTSSHLPIFSLQPVIHVAFLSQCNHACTCRNPLILLSSIMWAKYLFSHLPRRHFHGPGQVHHWFTHYASILAAADLNSSGVAFRLLLIFPSIRCNQACHIVINMFTILLVKQPLPLNILPWKKADLIDLLIYPAFLICLIFLLCLSFLICLTFLIWFLLHTDMSAHVLLKSLQSSPLLLGLKM